MAIPRLSDKDIEKAARLLDGWTSKLTWDRFLAVFATEVGHHYTKPGLRKHPRILNAWDMAQKRLSEGMKDVGLKSNGDAAIVEANRRVATLRAENAKLIQENRDLLERFLRWSLNAAQAGLSPERLDAEIIGLGSHSPNKPTRIK